MIRVPAADLVKIATSRTKPATWFDKISREDREYITDVIHAMKLRKISTFHTIAAAVKNELHLPTCITSIKNTMREMYNAKT
jgi:hypothetical protein